MATLSVRQRNVERLIARCENILSGKTDFQGKEWKLGKYVSALDEQIKELEKFPSVDQDLLRSFHQRAAVLHDVVKTESEPLSLANGLLSSIPPEPSSLPHSPVHTGSRPTLNRQLSHSKGNELLQMANVKRHTTMRDELFANSSDDPGDSDGTLRHRGSSSLESNIETVLQRHQKMQDDIAEDMVNLAQSLKHNALAAKDIIIKDKEVLVKTAQVAEKNIEGIDRETGRLKEHNRGCSWWIWLMLVVVFVVFVAMVMFIRVVPKPTIT